MRAATAAQLAMARPCVQVEVCKEQVEWASREKRTFLRQRIEARLAGLYLANKDYTAALGIISRLLTEVLPRCRSAHCLLLAAASSLRCLPAARPVTPCTSCHTLLLCCMNISLGVGQEARRQAAAGGRAPAGNARPPLPEEPAQGQGSPHSCPYSCQCHLCPPGHPGELFLICHVHSSHVQWLSSLGTAVEHLHTTRVSAVANAIEQSRCWVGELTSHGLCEGWQVVSRPVCDPGQILDQSQPLMANVACRQTWTCSRECCMPRRRIIAQPTHTSLRPSRLSLPWTTQRLCR